MTGFLLQIAQRAGWAVFAAAIGRATGPSIGHWLIRRTVQPYLLTFGAVAVGAVVATPVALHLAAGHPAVSRWLNTIGTTIGVAAGGMAVVLGIVYFVAANEQTPITRALDWVVASLANTGNPMTLTDAELRVIYMP